MSVYESVTNNTVRRISGVSHEYYLLPIDVRYAVPVETDLRRTQDLQFVA